MRLGVFVQNQAGKVVKNRDREAPSAVTEIPSQKKELPTCILTHTQGYVAQRDRIGGNVEND
jgi:hypothetical protein